MLVVVTHLHHLVGTTRSATSRRGSCSPGSTKRRRRTRSIAVGDFNAEPLEPTYARMVAAGFRSAYAEANGAEPAVTWPSGLQAPAMDTDGDPGCLDYIWVRGAVRVGVRGSCSIGRSGGPDALPERPPRASARASRSA